MSTVPRWFFVSRAGPPPKSKNGPRIARAVQRKDSLRRTAVPVSVRDFFQRASLGFHPKQQHRQRGNDERQRT